MNKQLLRQQMKESLAKMTTLEYEQYSFQIAQQLFSLPLWQRAETIAVTVSRVPEVDTWSLITRGWEEGKKVVVPKCNPADRSMDYYQLTSFCELETVYSGLYEPDPLRTAYVEPKEIDVLLVPGLAFDQRGYRLGFGGGYFDRFLEHFQGPTLALLFSQQLLAEVPREAYDLPVQQLITERQLYNCSSE
ncbi:5-formyltetrahydrofolate cyclo-ligase [Bacillus sp. REN10]|uniref:5-formyltetrahydrofolate cyclo-ligase n=1 Tax=Bacillus sp. REN10 TaxID=2782541 RepID=UPI00193C1221|nr:5-formyltetrahydrofolate cyclo-ligase [Bacillus sp. REN10]